MSGASVGGMFAAGREVAAGGRSAWVAGGDGVAVGLLSSSTIVGLHWSGVAAGGSGFVGSDPIGGKVELEGLLVGPQRVPAAGDPHRFQLAVASEVPAGQADLDGGEQLFPRVSQADATRNDLVVVWGDAGLFIPVGTVMGLSGRRFVGRWYNGATVAADAFIGIVVHRVIGGAGSGDPHFLEGESVRDS